MAQAAGYRTPRFLTFKQALELGGNVRKGEHGTKVYFVKQLQVQDKGANDETATRLVPMMREYTVFNVDQCDNLPDSINTGKPMRVRNPDARDELADAFLHSTGADIREGHGEACYIPSRDFISMPAFAGFKEADHFYNVLFHELCHWSGHKSRLDRDLKNRFGSRNYAAEELIAELGAAFLCAEFGFDGDVRNAGYSGMRWSTLLELSGMELHEVAHVRRCLAGEVLHGVRHAVVTPLPVQLGHGREMVDDVLRKPRPPKAFAPRREWEVAISDGPAERF